MGDLKSSVVKVAAIIGGGVIGGGWAARFLLQGWTVNVFDPDPQAERKISEVLANARRSLPLLSDSGVVVEGKLNFHDSIESAVKNASWIQESVPERLEIKHATFAEIFKTAPDHAIVGSSTSGYKPSELQQNATYPERIVVAHPFNPVYLLPLVELVPGDAGRQDVIARAQQLLTSIGMKPLHVRKEIDAHIADRFLEAVWREGLWLIKDDIATTEEIDDAIRYGFGLRWAQMGLFETYRIAGGEAGMEHFIAQFGPCLSWPWTKLMDVPELDDALINKIASQSDQQSGKYSIRELEQIRDDNLVGILQALKQREWGAGKILIEHDRRQQRVQQEQKAVTPDAVTPDHGKPDSGPLQLTRGTVLPSWLDYNQHMTEHRYLEVCSKASDAMITYLGGSISGVAEGAQSPDNLFTVETHIRHIGQLFAGEAWHTTTHFVWADDKRLKVVHSVHSTQREALAATCEQLFLCVDLKSQKATPFSESMAREIAALVSVHSELALQDGIGQSTGSGFDPNALSALGSNRGSSRGSSRGSARGSAHGSHEGQGS